MTIAWASQTSATYDGGVFINPALMYNSGGVERYHSIHCEKTATYAPALVFTDNALTSLGTVTSVPPLSTTVTDAFSTKLSDGRLFVGGSAWGSNLYSLTTWLGTYNSSTDTYSWVKSTDLPGGIGSLTGDPTHVDSCVLLADGRICLWNNQGACYLGTVSGNAISWVGCSQSGWIGSNGSSYVRLPDNRILASIRSGDSYLLGTVSGDSISWVYATTVGVPSNFVVNPRLCVSPSGVVVAYGDQSKPSGYLTTGNFQAIEVSGDTLTFSSAGDKPTALGEYDQFYGAWFLQSGKLALVTTKVAVQTTNAVFVGSFGVALSGALSSSSLLSAQLYGQAVALFADLVSTGAVVGTLTDFITLLQANLGSTQLLTALFSDLQANLEVQQALSATLGDYAPPIVPIKLKAGLFSGSTIDAALFTQKQFAAALQSGSLLQGNLLAGQLLSAHLTGNSWVDATLSVEKPLEANLRILPLLVADLTRGDNLHADLVSNSTLAGVMLIRGSVVDDVFVFTSSSDLSVMVPRHG